jgi:hypothetical protein
VGGAGIVPLVAVFHLLPWIAGIEGPKELWLSASAVLTIGAIITFISLLFSPETKDFDLRRLDVSGKRKGKDISLKIAEVEE